MDEVLCPYCGEPAVMSNGAQIYGSMHRRARENFWICWQCDAYVGTHSKNKRLGLDGTEPLGTLANRELRKARVVVHNMFDPLWRDGTWTRKEAYDWFARRMGVPVSECHIGHFDVEQCRLAIGALKGIEHVMRKNKLIVSRRSNDGIENGKNG